MPALTPYAAGWRIAVVVPVREDLAALPELAGRVDRALHGLEWRMRLVIDADPQESVRPAHDLARADRRVAVSGLTVDGGPAAAVRHGLAVEADADAWVCMEGSVPHTAGALPLLVDRLAGGDVEAVLAEARSTPLPLLGRLLGPVARLVPGLVPLDVSLSALRPPARAAVLAADGTDVRTSLARAGVPTSTMRIGRSSS